MKLTGLLSNHPTAIKECSTLTASLVVPLLKFLPSDAVKSTLFGRNFQFVLMVPLQYTPLFFKLIATVVDM
jgi:hypothetical protein